MEITTDDLRNGVHSAYKHVFSLWYEPLCNYACSLLRDMDEAEDAVQKIFVKLWDQHQSINIQTSIKSYLYRAVHNDCLNRIKQHKVRSEHNDYYAYSSLANTNSTSEQVMYSELQSEIAKAINTLPPKCKRVFELSRIEQLSYAEIGAELGISTNTVENHISKALRLMNQSLKDFLPIIVVLILKTFK